MATAYDFGHKEVCGFSLDWERTLPVETRLELEHSPRICLTAPKRIAAGARRHSLNERFLGVVTQFDILNSTNMATTGNTTEPRVDASSDFSEIWKIALGRYEKDTETNFQDLDSANNADDVLTHIRESEENFKNHRHPGSKTDKFRKLVSRALVPIDGICSVTAGAVSSVRIEVLAVC